MVESRTTGMSFVTRRFGLFFFIVLLFLLERRLANF